MTTDVSVKLPRGTVSVKRWYPFDGSAIRATTPRAMCLHGWQDNAGSFDFLVPALQRLLPSMAFYCLDLPNHGKSSHRGYPGGILDDITDIAIVCGCLQLPPALMIGHSQGGLLAALLAAYLPQLVTHVVLLDMVWYPYYRGITIQETTEFLEKRVANGGVVIPKRYPSYDALRERYRQGLFMKELTQTQVDQLLVRGAVQDPSDGLWVFTMDPLTKHGTSNTSMDFLTRLELVRSIRAPVLYVMAKSWYGGNAKEAVQLLRYQREVAAEFRSLGQSLYAVSMDEAPHHLHMTHPDKVAAHIVKFYKELPKALSKL